MTLRICLIVITLGLIPITVCDNNKGKDDCCDFKSRIVALENFVSNLNDRLSRGAAALFYISPEYKGRKYYLSKKSGSAAIPVSETICEVFGGYLVEINDQDEYRFVQNFIRNNAADFFAVYTGGNDEAVEGTWVFRHSKEQVIFKDWSPGQPTNDEDGDCLILLNSNDWKMDDFRCYYDGQDTRYMCEIPINK